MKTLMATLCLLLMGLGINFVLGLGTLPWRIHAAGILARALSCVTEAIGLIVVGRRLYTLYLEVLTEEDEKELGLEADETQSKARIVTDILADLSDNREEMNEILRRVVEEAGGMSGREYIQSKAKFQLAGKGLDDTEGVSGPDR